MLAEPDLWSWEHTAAKAQEYRLHLYRLFGHEYLQWSQQQEGIGPSILNPPLRCAVSEKSVGL